MKQQQDWWILTRPSKNLLLNAQKQRSANSSYSYGNRALEFLVETRPQVAELGLVGDSATPIGFTLQSDVPRRFFHDHLSMDVMAWVHLINKSYNPYELL